MSYLDYGAPADLGKHPNDAAALTFLQNNDWDTNGDGSGNPQDGMFYYNDVLAVFRNYLGGTWVNAQNISYTDADLQGFLGTNVAQNGTITSAVGYTTFENAVTVNCTRDGATDNAPYRWYPLPYGDCLVYCKVDFQILDGCPAGSGRYARIMMYNSGDVGEWISNAQVNDNGGTEFTVMDRSSGGVLAGGPPWVGNNRADIWMGLMRVGVEYTALWALGANPDPGRLGWSITHEIAPASLDFTPLKYDRFCISVGNGGASFVVNEVRVSDLTVLPL